LRFFESFVWLSSSSTSFTGVESFSLRTKVLTLGEQINTRLRTLPHQIVGDSLLNNHFVLFRIQNPGFELEVFLKPLANNPYSELAAMGLNQSQQSISTKGTTCLSCPLAPASFSSSVVACCNPSILGRAIGSGHQVNGTTNLQRSDDAKKLADTRRG
jgi:hypothetical protein